MRHRLFSIPILALILLVGARTSSHAAQPVPLATVPVAESPNAVAVDGRTARAFVTTLSTTSGAHGAVYVFDAATGHTLNTVDIGDTAGASPAIAVDEPHTHVFVSNPTQTAIYVLDAQAGTVLRTLTLGQGIAFLAVDVSSGMLYAADLNDNSLKIVDPSSGAVLRAIALPGTPNALLASSQSGQAFVLSNASAGAAARLLILDTATGTILHQTDLPNDSFSQMALDERTGHLFVTYPGPSTGATGPTGPGSVSMLEAHSGALLRTTTVGSFPHQLAADAQTGRIFVSNGRSTIVSMLDSATGALFGTVAVGTNPWGLAVSPDGRHVLVAGRGCPAGLHGCNGPAGPGNVSMLDGGFGAYLGSFNAGTGPTAVAIDPQTKHAFVINAGIISASVPKDLPASPSGSVTALDIANL